MIKLVQRALPLLLLVVFFSNCRKKAFDEFYGRPENLAAPIYQQLQAKGKFKNIPYFLDNFLAANQLTSADYNYFYPNTTYSGCNVVDAKVVTPDIVAEIGFIHEVDKVLLPLPNIDQYLASNPQYSEFKKLFDKYIVQFVLSADATARYKLLGGNSDVYIKTYNPGLGFSLNNENF